jgi:ribosomal protein S18 acetylase RimI-like enzyme
VIFEKNRAPSKRIQVSELLYFGFALRYRLPQTGAGILRAETIRLVSGLIDSTPQTDNSGERRDVRVADATFSNLAEFIELDARVTGFARAEFGNDLLRRRAASDTLCVLVATKSGKIVGYAAGEVRSWQVRAPACGWLYAINVDERYRLHKYASSLMAELISRFKQSGVGTIRTVIDVDDHLPMSFLRSCGMRTGSFVELEMTLPANVMKSGFDAQVSMR